MWSCELLFKCSVSYVAGVSLAGFIYTVSPTIIPLLCKVCYSMNFKFELQVKFGTFVEQC